MIINEEKEIDPDIYVQKINEGATHQEAFEAATENSDEEEKEESGTT